jgi:hypothetical protein
MYTDREVIECDVFLRRCLSNTCTSYWDGCEDSVFCLSKSTCAGYELGKKMSSIECDVVVVVFLEG